MGSFRLTAGTPHLHGEFNFTESLLETAGKSLRPCAGRNLPDKEFRYLRTVIVTAAVYRGFDSKLAPLLLTFLHRAGVRPYTSPCGFAEPCVFVKQSPPPGLCPPIMVAHNRGLISRSYGGNLPSSFSRVLSSALVYSTCPPVSVSGTVSCGGYFLEPVHCTPNPIRMHNLPDPSPSAGWGLLTPFPSTTPFGLALGAG